MHKSRTVRVARVESRCMSSLLNALRSFGLVEFYFAPVHAVRARATTHPLRTTSFKELAKSGETSGTLAAVEAFDGVAAGVQVDAERASCDRERHELKEIVLT
jgi:hypothetical protein